MYEKEYVRGSILDRNGNTIAFSQKPGGTRTYSHPYAFSNMDGYWSKIFGTYGVEKTMNDVLVHSDCGNRDQEKRGADVTLTIDAALQEQAYKDIKKYKGSVVVMNAKTGELLALASSPTFNVTEIEEKWKEINEKEGVFFSNAYQNPVAPGSVFKLVTSKEIIEAGIEKEEVEDTGSLKVNGQTIRNYGGKAYGSIAYREGFVKSSNVYFMNRALKLGGLRLYKTGRSFLLGEDISLDFEEAVRVPLKDISEKKSFMKKPAKKFTKEPVKKQPEKTVEKKEEKPVEKKPERKPENQPQSKAEKEVEVKKEEPQAKPAVTREKLPINKEAAEKDAKEFLEKMFAAMDSEVCIKTSFDKDDNLNIELSGKDMGVLIGKRGQTLDSIQYLTSLVVNKGNAGYVRVKVDTENYRARRKETLENLAKNIAFKVKRTKKPVFLEPMNPYERRVIHSALQNDPLVSTHSEGEEPYRKVVVTLKKQ